MRLRILLPYQVFADEANVASVSAEGLTGSFGLLPHRLDCVAALVPGILSYRREAGDAVYVALDEGVLAKTGADVLVSVRHAISGTDLAKLQDAVKREFLKLDQEELDVRAAVAKLEGGFVSRFAEFQHHG
jgi:F-type H+-transporting ATPase subunit epsilon